ncbi:MAG: hypothetical protein U0270_04505 [Labilithrix sp.]
MKARTLALGMLVTGAALSVSRGAVADKGGPPPAAQAVTVDFSMSEVKCAPGGMLLTAKVKSNGAAFDGSFVASTGEPPSLSFHLDAGGTKELSTKTGIGCQRTPNLNAWTGTVKNGAGQTAATKTFNLKSFGYLPLTARPPSAGSGTKNILFVSSVAVEAICGQPLTITVSGNSYQQDATPYVARVYAELEYNNASDKNRTLSDGNVHVEPPSRAFTSKLVGPAVDCSIAAPTIKPHVSLGAMTVPIQGVLESSPAMKPDSETWQ